MVEVPSVYEKNGAVLRSGVILVLGAKTFVEKLHAVYKIVKEQGNKEITDDHVCGKVTFG